MFMSITAEDCEEFCSDLIFVMAGSDSKKQLWQPDLESTEAWQFLVLASLSVSVDAIYCTEKHR